MEGQTKKESSDAAPLPADEYTVYDRFRQLMAESGVTEDDVRKVVAMKGHFPEDTQIKDYGDSFITGWLFKYWPQITEIIARMKTDGTNN